MACAAFTPSWLRPAGVLSDVHRELREGHLDAARIEGELHPLEELALYVPLLDRWYHLEPAAQHDRRVLEALDAEDLDVVGQPRSPLAAAAHRLPGSPHQADRLADVDAVADADADPGVPH